MYVIHIEDWRAACVRTVSKNKALLGKLGSKRKLRGSHPIKGQEYKVGV